MASSPGALWIKGLIYESFACVRITKDNNLDTLHQLENKLASYSDLIG